MRLPSQATPRGNTDTIVSFLFVLQGDFSFFVKPGRSGNVMVDFEGGGACWDAGSCLLPIYSRGVNVGSQLNYLNGQNSGILSGSNPRNPFFEDTQVFVPYCTADAHAGNNTVNYGYGEFPHVGRANAAAAFEWIKNEIPDSADTRVTVTGCSAGSLGAMANAAYLLDDYPQADKYVFGDSYIGVFAEQQFDQALENWGLEFAPFLTNLQFQQGDFTPDVGAKIWSESANYFPNSKWSGYTSNGDSVQGSFYALGGGSQPWTEEMRMITSTATTDSDNFFTFIAPGSAHCVSNGNAFYSVNSAGNSLSSWVEALIDGEPVRNVDCRGNGC